MTVHCGIATSAHFQVPVTLQLYL